MTDIERDDVSAMRQQGDLQAFMRQQIADGRSRRTSRASPGVVRPPGHRPGAWPTGTSPPSPPPPIPPEAMAAALEDFRAHRFETGTGQRCLCRPCRLLAQARPEEDQ